MSDGFIPVPYEQLSDEELARIFSDYLMVTVHRGFKFPRETLIAELERVSEWLLENQKVYESMNGGRQL